MENVLSMTMQASGQHDRHAICEWNRHPYTAILKDENDSNLMAYKRVQISTNEPVIMCVSVTVHLVQALNIELG